IHWCLNFVCEDEGVASAVLIRAVQPERGIEEMRRRRGVSDTRLLCSGPGRLCQALGITGDDDGLRLDKPPFRIVERSADVDVATGPRIGITQAADRPWRYCVVDSRYLSRRMGIASRPRKRRA